MTDDDRPTFAPVDESTVPPLTLDDVASELVQLAPDDVEGAHNLAELATRFLAETKVSRAVAELIGGAIERFRAVGAGEHRDPATALADAGYLIEAALNELEDLSAFAMPPDRARPVDAARPLPELAAEPPLPIVADDTDFDLLPDFLGEAGDYLAGAEAGLLRLETDPDDVEAINEVFRAFHTVKGTSAFVRLPAVTELAHRAESLLSRMRAGQIPCRGGYADLALRAVDGIKFLLVALSDGVESARAIDPSRYMPLLGVLADLERADINVDRESPSAPADPETASGGEPAHPSRGAPPPAAVASPRSTPVPPEPAEPQDGTMVPGTGRAETAPSPSAADGGRARAGEPVPESSVRVRTDRLDRLIDMVGELVIAHSMLAQDETLAGGTHGGAVAAIDALGRKVGQASKIVRELQDLSLAMRMVPLRATFQRLARAVRDIARQVDKSVELVAEGEDTEIDRNMVDLLADPLLHMVRNAIDHGIESVEERRRRGKRDTGTIQLAAYHASGSVVVELSDDGRGLDRERIRARAIERGVIAADAELTESEVYGLIFEPGFSTAEQVTSLSGRGVGMDVVKRAVEALRGRIEIVSRPGEGTRFTVRVPLTLAMTDGMVVRVGIERYIVPTVNIRMSFRPGEAELSTVAGRGELVRLRDELLPIARLSRLFAIPDAIERPTEGLLVVLDDGERWCALLVDELLGQQQVVAKTLGAYLGRVDGVSGAAILGDGRVGLILDAVDLSALARRQPSSRGAPIAGANGHHERSGAMSASPSGGSAGQATNGRAVGGKFLTFRLGREEYGLEILKVHEIIALLPITQVPGTPDFIRGVVNLRGKVIPVMDLRRKLGMEPVEPTVETCIVVVHAAGVEVGLIVDRVSEVVDVPSESIDPMPAFGPDVAVEFILGIGKSHGSVKLLIDIERVLSSQEVIDLRSAARIGASA